MVTQAIRDFKTHAILVYTIFVVVPKVVSFELLFQYIIFAVEEKRRTTSSVNR